jgi:hypothetical protein
MASDDTQRTSGLNPVPVQPNAPQTSLPINATIMIGTLAAALLLALLGIIILLLRGG